MQRLLAGLERCVEDSLPNPQCSSEHLCQDFPFFVCGHDGGLTKIGLGTQDMRNVAATLRFLPSTVKGLQLRDNDLTVSDIDLTALRGTALEELMLTDNDIRSIALRDLRGSSLKRLDVYQESVHDERAMDIDVRGTADLTLKTLFISDKQTINGQLFIQYGTVNWALFEDTSVKTVYVRGYVDELYNVNFRKFHIKYKWEEGDTPCNIL